MERKGFKQRCTAFLLAVFIIISIFPVSVSADTAAAQWSISADTVIYLVETGKFEFSEELRAQVALFSQELYAKGLTKAPLDIVYGDSKYADKHDILLYLDKSLGLANEAYQIEVNVNGQLIIKASDSDGLFYGCRHVIKALIAETGLSDGTVEEKPDYPERAFFVDCGRKYYSPDWIEDMIREISWSNMNAIYLHFSEEMGFRLESKTYPWLAGGDNTLCVSGSDAGVASDNDKCITQEQMREIAKVAKLYHVEIIPSLDSPGHMNYAVKKYNEQYGTNIGNYFHYNGKTAIVQGSGPEAAQKSYSRGIDISNEEALTFAKKLYSEYAAFFKELGCTKFDIGGDELLGWGSAVTTTVSKWQQLDHWKEYAQNRAKSEGKSNYSSAVAYDAFMYYMNDIYELVKSYGYTSVRMWNDDALRSADTGWQKVVTLNKNIEIQYWTPTANSSTNNSTNNVWTYINEGYKAYNFLNSYNYYVLGQAHNGSGYEGLTEPRIYENWAPNVFAPYGNNNTGLNTAIGNSSIKGSAFCVWCDSPSSETAAQVKAGILPFIRVNGAKAWDADINASIDFATAKGYFDKFGNVPEVGTNTTTPNIVHYTMPDISKLEAEINVYRDADPKLYTEETFNAYKLAADAGSAVIASVRPSKEDVD